MLRKIVLRFAFLLILLACLVVPTTDLTRPQAAASVCCSVCQEGRQACKEPCAALPMPDRFYCNQECNQQWSGCFSTCYVGC